jgi:hypothetical protein
MVNLLLLLVLFKLLVKDAPENLEAHMIVRIVRTQLILSGQYSNRNR